MSRPRLAASLLLLLSLSCGSTRDSQAGAGSLLPVKDAAWAGGACQPVLKSRNILGLCSVVTLFKDGSFNTPTTAVASAVRQGTEQMSQQAGEMLTNVLKTCTSGGCGNLLSLPSPGDVMTRIGATAAQSLKATDLSMSQSGAASVLLVVDGNDIFQAVRQEKDLDDAAREAIIGRAKDALRQNQDNQK